MNARKVLFLVVTCVAASLSMGPDARAKGYGAGTGAGSTLESGAAEAGLVDWEQELEQQRLASGGALGCPEPTNAQCISALYGRQRCGRYYRKRARLGLEPPCSCPRPSLARCTDPDYLQSVCGDWWYSWSHSYTPEPDCDPQTEGTCTRPCTVIVEERLGNDQTNDGTVVPGALAGPVVAYSLATAGTGDPVRDRLSLEHNGYGDLGSFVTLPQVKPSYVDFYSGTNTPRWWSKMLDDHVAHLQDSSTVTEQWIANHRVGFVADRSAYAANGVAVADCDEYVYEKYYDYSAFEDAMREAGVDYRRIFEIAYGDAGVASSIGTRGKNGALLRMRDTTPLPQTSQIHWPYGPHPLNIFYTISHPTPVSDATRTDVLQKLADNGGRMTIEALGYGELGYQVSRPFTSLFGFIARDDSLHDDLKVLPTVDESFAWHESASQQLADVPDEALYAYDRLKEEFAVMLGRRLAIWLRLTSAFRDALEDTATDTIIVNESVFDPNIFVNPSDMFGYDDVLFQQRGLRESFELNDFNELGNVSATPRLFGVSLVGLGESLFQGAGANTSTRSGNAGDVVIEIDGFGDAWSSATSGSFGFIEAPPQYGVFDEIGRALADLQDIDDSIEALLLYVQDECLGAPGGPAGTVRPCDWSPRRFFTAVERQLTVQREMDYDRCITFTGYGTFEHADLTTSIPGRMNPNLDGSNTLPYPTVQDCYGPSGCEQVACSDGPYNASPRTFEMYPKCHHAWRTAVLRNLEELLEGAKDLWDPLTNQITPNQTVNDYGTYGDDTFGAGYGYYVQWSMDLPPAPVGGGDLAPAAACDTTPSLYAQMNVDATIFGRDVTIVDAALTAQIGGDTVNRASMEIMGVSLIDVESSSAALSPTKFNTIFEAGDSRFDEYFSASATFMIGPVPVTVSAGAGGLLSATLSARGGNRTGGGGCGAGDVVIEGNFEPMFALTAFASAGIDALVVEAGLKVDLLIVGVSFPFTAAVNMARRNVGGDDDIFATVDADLDIAISILGGRVSAYVEVCFIFCESFDVTLFEWAPTRFTHNLLHASHSFPIGKLALAQDTLAGSLP